jgi:nucleoside-diphosphate-sugar epimerase
VYGSCAVTGANGYVGSCVAKRVADAGWEVIALTRSQPPQLRGRASYRHFELGGALSPRLLEGAHALVHVAYDFAHTGWGDIQRVNVVGSERLFAAARAAGVDRIICVSTIAAFPGARSLYGRAKLEIEQAALNVGATVIRPALVWGPDGAAMFGALRRVASRLAVIPLPVPAQLELSTVHEDDLAMLVERVLECWPESSGKVLVAASESRVSFEDLLRLLARPGGRQVRFVRLPWRLAWLVLRAIEAVGVKPPFRSDSLASIVALDGDPRARATDSAERYGVHFRALSL